MIRRTLHGLLFGLALAVASPAPTAQATSLAPLTTEQFTNASTYIVQGTVTDVWSEVDDSGHVWSRARVRVSHVFKGPDAPETMVIDVLGGELGQLRSEIPGRARFSSGEEMLVFLADVDFGRRLTPVGAFTGKHTIRRAPGERRQHVMRWHGDPDEAFDARFLPNPPADERVYLDDLVADIEARLDTGWDGQPIPGLAPEKLERLNTPARRLR